MLDDVFDLLVEASNERGRQRAVVPGSDGGAEGSARQSQGESLFDSANLKVMEKLEDLMHVDKNLLPLKQTGLSQPIGFAQTNFKGAGTVGDPHTMVEAGDDPQKSKLSDPPKPWLPTEVQLFIRALENTGFEDMPTRFRAFDQVQKKWLPRTPKPNGLFI